MSTQALIAHIETHMVDDSSASRRQSNSLSLIPYQRNNPYNTNPSSSASSMPPNLLSFSPNSYNLPSLQETRNNPMLSGNPQMVSPRPIFPPQPPLSLLAMRKNNNYPSIGSQLQISVALSQRKTMEEHPSVDCTKPFIEQLDKPYSSKTEMKDDNKSDLDMLDLTLKL
eukprot:XP_002528836.2 uncharacterized protein LOC8263762 [Ricinus communis]